MRQPTVGVDAGIRSDEGRAGAATGWVLLGTAVATEVCATLALRASLDQPWWLILVIAGYAAAFTALTLVLGRGVPLGVAYGIWAASGVALTAVLAHVLFADPLTWLMGAGVVCIGAGVLLVETGSAGGRRRSRAETEPAQGRP